MISFTFDSTHIDIVTIVTDIIMLSKLIAVRNIDNKKIFPKVKEKGKDETGMSSNRQLAVLVEPSISKCNHT